MSKLIGKKFGPGSITDYALKYTKGIEGDLDYVSKNMEKIRNIVKLRPELERNKFLQGWLDDIDQIIRTAGGMIFNLRPSTNQILEEIKK